MKYTYLISWIVIVLTSLIYYQNQPIEVISWDVYGYYSYLPGIFIYEDVPNYGFVASHFSKYNVSANLYQLAEIQEGVFAPIYTMGMAILWLPFFFIAHIITQLTGIYPADGMSFYYQLAIVTACWFYGQPFLIP